MPDSDLAKKINSISLNLSKSILSVNCAIQAREAAKKNRIWETIARIIEPLFLLVERRVEDLGLARGIGLGLSQFVLAQEGIFKHLLIKKGLDSKKGATTMGMDHDLNSIACRKLFKELFTNGIGKGRRFLTGFTIANIEKKLLEFKKQFKLSSIKELWNKDHGNYAKRFMAFCKASGIDSVREMFAGDKDRDRGHTTLLSGVLMVVGALMGYVDKHSKGFFYKLGGTVRNLGGAVADVGLFSHPDANQNIGASFLSVNTVMDTFQRFIGKAKEKLILPWANVSMAAYNIGVAFYLNRSTEKTDEKEDLKTYDTDLAAAAAA